MTFSKHQVYPAQVQCAAGEIHGAIGLKQLEKLDAFINEACQHFVNLFKNDQIYHQKEAGERHGSVYDGR